MISIKGRKFLSFCLLCAILIMIRLLLEDGVIPPQSAMAQFETGTLTITDVSNSDEPVYQVGNPQSFVIDSISTSFQCDLPGVLPHQQVQLLTARVMLKVEAIDVSVPSHCWSLSNIEVEVREAVFGEALAAVPVSLNVPTDPAGEWVTANFERAKLFLDPGTTYYLAVNYLASKTSPAYSISQGSQLSRQLGTPVSVDDIGSMAGGVVASGIQGETCPQAWPTFAVSWRSNSQNPYSDGSYYTSNAVDATAVLDYKYVHKVNVVALVYDPIINTVNYTDLLSPQYPIQSFAVNKRLHEVLKDVGLMDRQMSDPLSQVADLEQALETSSGGTVNFEVTTIDVLDWSWHQSSNITFGSPSLPVISIPGFTKWTMNTWPCYLEIPKSIPIGGQQVLRRACFPSGIGPADYNKFFDVSLGQKTLFDAVNDGEVDDIWIFTDVTAATHESAMAVGDSGLRLNNAAPIPIERTTAGGQVESLARNVPVMGFNFQTGLGGALHSYGHRTETIMAGVLEGNRHPSCTNNKSDSTLYGKFSRIYDCHEDAGTAIPPGKVGGVGIIHKAWNVPVPIDPTLRSPAARQASTAVATAYAAQRNNIWAHDITSWSTPAPSDEQDWFYFPDFPGIVRDISCVVYGCTGEGYYQWWFQHIPRYADDTSNEVPENLWPFISSPGCFQSSRIPNPLDSLTPGPGTPTAAATATP